MASLLELLRDLRSRVEASGLSASDRQAIEGGLDRIQEEAAGTLGTDLTRETVGGDETSLTAGALGAPSLAEREPALHARFVARWASILERAVERQAYKTGDQEGALAAEVRTLGSELAELRASARDVMTLHSLALRLKTEGASASRGHALVIEGRLVALQLMGQLLSFYRRYAPAGRGGR